VTLLFADLVESTAMGERLDHERLHQILARYFDAMREEIEAEGGTVEKFIGDAVVAAFGTPTAHEDDAARGLRAALRMQVRLLALNGELEAEFGQTLRMRIGVNTGEVLVSLDPARGEPMFTGDAANTAARFEQHAEPGQVLASERTVRAARGFTVIDAGLLEMKGKAAQVRAFRVVAQDHAEPRGIPGLSAPMVGRDAELELLTSTLARVAAERRPQLVTIYGEPGVGKSRLVQEFLSASEASGERCTVVRGRCLPYGDGVTYFPLAEILKGVAGVRDSDAPAVALEKVRHAGAALLGAEPDAVRATAALAFTMGLDDPAVRLDGLDPKQVRAEIGAAWPRFFSALAADAPVLALIEDIHWADPALLDLVEQLAEQTEGPVLLLCPARPELLGDRPTWGGGKRNYSALSLDPLTPEEAEYLINTLLNIVDLPPHVHRQILERADGNPFFLEEIVRQLVDGGMVVREGEGWRATGDVETVVIPDTVQAVLAARIDLLERGSRRALQAAAVVGRVFWPGAVARLVPGDAAGLADALAPLQARDLIRARPASALAGEPEYIFKHVLTRDVAYETIPRAERAAAHAAVAGWIEDTVGDRLGEFVELLAYHYVEAHRSARESVGATVDLASVRKRAFDLSMHAARAAQARLALHRGERFSRQALDLAVDPTERSLAAEMLGRIHLDAYQGTEAWEAYGIAIREALADPESDGVRIAGLCAAATLIATRWAGSMRVWPTEEEVSHIIEIGVTRLPAGDSLQRVQLLAVRSSWAFAFPWLNFDDQQLQRYKQDGLEAAEAALRLELPDVASSAFDSAAGGAITSGRYLEVTEIEARRLKLVERLQDPLEIGDTFSMMSWCKVSTGDYREAEGFAERGLSMVRTTSESASVHLLAWLVDARCRLGEWDRALSAFQELQELLGDRREDPPYFSAQAFGAAMWIRDHRGEVAEANRLGDILIQRGPRPPGGSGPIRAWAVAIPMMVARGDLEGARERLDDRLPGWKNVAVSLFEGAGAWVAASGSWDRAAAFIEEMRAFAAYSGCRPVGWEADLLDGRWRSATGDVEAAVSSFVRAREGFAEGGAVHEVAVCDLEIASARGRGALTPQEQRRLDEAARRFEGLRSVRDLDRIRAL